MKKIIIILLFPIFVQAQTTFYFNMNNVYRSTITPNAGWNVTTGYVCYYMEAHKDQSTIASDATASIGASAVRKSLSTQFISAPLQAQTLNGTLDGQIRMNQSSTSSTTGQGFVYVRIIKPDNTVRTEVGTMTTTNLTTTLTNRTLIQLALSSVSVSDGDRICIEVGWNESVGTNTTRTGTFSFGSSNTTDLPVDNTTTTANSPWIKFSQTILFKATGGFAL